MDFLAKLKERAGALNKHIVLPEGDDDRTITAAAMIVKEKVAKVTVLGDVGDMKARAEKLNLDLSGVNLVFPPDQDNFEEYVNKYLEMRKHKGMTPEQAKETMMDFLFYGVMMLKEGVVDGCVAGAVHATSMVIKAGIQILKTAPGLKTVSSCFLMILPEPTFGEEGVLVYGDCGVVPDPTLAQLVDIAISTSASTKALVGVEPKVAMLSFSTKGSAKAPNLEKVIEATKIVKEKLPNLLIDGELQFDTAVIPAIAAKKAPGAPIQGNANTFIFPDLNAGNICYKVTERLAKAVALGPLLQGLSKPLNDLSRGCSADDIALVSAITALQTQIKTD
jgi:phosphate acetyltransferase